MFAPCINDIQTLYYLTNAQILVINQLDAQNPVL